MNKITTIFRTSALLLASATLNAAPPVVDVVVTNDDANPVPVSVQNPGPGGPVEVYSTLPEFYRVNKTVFGNGDDRIERVPVEESVILYDIFARTGTIRDVSGCAIDVFQEVGGEGGPLVFLFEVTHSEMDTSVSRDGQKTQQRLGRGVVVPAGDNIVIRVNNVTDSDIPPFLPNAFCSATVQIFGEVIQN